MRGEQNLQDTIRDGKNSWSLKQRGDMRVEGKKFSVGGYGGGENFLGSLEGGYGEGEKKFGLLRGGIWRGRNFFWVP